MIPINGEPAGRGPRSMFLRELEGIPLGEIARQVGGASPLEARKALEESPLSLRGVAILLGAARGPLLAELLERAGRVTSERFGRCVLLYAPCYVSSFCVNHCRYCGFNFRMPIRRRQLTPAETLAETALLVAQGFRRVLLVAGEYPSKVSREYLSGAIGAMRSLVPEVDLEVGPADEEDYDAWGRAGASGLVCYQETYQREPYALLHPRGPKSRYEFRLGTLERAGRAGMCRLGLGVLLGLANPVMDLLAVIAHARFLAREFPRARITASLPRLRPAVPSFRPAYVVDRESLVLYYALLRLALPDVGLVVSTRESAELRGRLLKAGATQMSAGSVTTPGGYASGERGGGQFEIADQRSPKEVVRDLESHGYRVIWRGGAVVADSSGAAWA